MESKKDIDLEIGEGLKDILYKIENYEDMRRTYAVMKIKLDQCKESIITSSESREYGLFKGSLLSSILGYYKEILLKEIENDIK